MKYITILFMTLFVLSCGKHDEQADAYGNFEADEIIISSESNGRLIHFNLNQGMEIQAGDTIGLVDTTALFLNKQALFAQADAVKSKILSIKSQQKIVETERNTVLFEIKRAKDLVAGNAMPQKQLDDLENTLKVIDCKLHSFVPQMKSVQSEYNALLAKVKQLDDQINRCTLIAYADGLVLEKYVNQHELVFPGKSLYKMTDQKDLILKAYFSATQLDDLRIGEELKVYIDKSEDEMHELTGKLIWISEKAEFTPKIIQTREERTNLVYAVKILVQNDGRAKIGMPAEIRL